MTAALVVVGRLATAAVVVADVQDDPSPLEDGASVLLILVVFAVLVVVVVAAVYALTSLSRRRHR